MSDLASWSAVIVNHGTYADLADCLSSICRQTLAAKRVVVYDTSVDVPLLTDVCESARIALGRTDLVARSGKNLGYAGGANRGVELACAMASEVDEGLDFVLVLNPDVALDECFARVLVESVMADDAVAIATGKLLRPDRKTLDSAGIEIPRHRRPRDRGSESLDVGRYDRAEYVDAASGAAMLIRVSAIPDLAIEGELFDSEFFAYHEDTDLCWRARRLGYRVLYEPAAVAIHRRGWQKSIRKQIPTEIRRHSFKNHYWQIAKNETLGDGFRNLPWLIVWEVLRAGFVLSRDRELIAGYATAFRGLSRALRHRKLIAARARNRQGTGGTQRCGVSDSL